MTSGAELNRQMQALVVNGDDSFDPLQFRFIESLLAKLPQHQTEVAERLAKRAEEALQSYQQRLSVKQQDPAKPLVKPVSSSALASIIEELDKRGSEASASSNELSFEHLLGQQLEKTVAAGKLNKRSKTKSVPPEMASVRRMRETLARSGAQQRVRQALDNTPDDPGPLNPQKLAISSLALMNQLSPAYARHFVAYLDTLQWLDEAKQQLAD